MKKCPICRNKINYWKDTMEHILLEEEMECKQCGYIEYYGFGGYEVVIRDKYWQWSYNDSWKLKEKFFNEINIEIFYSKCIYWLGFR